MEQISKIIAIVVFLLQPTFNEAFGTHCDRVLIGREGAVSSYNFPLDYKKGLSCNYTHFLHEFTDDGKEVVEVCLQFKRFNLSQNDFLRIGRKEYTNRGESTMANLCVPVTNRPTFFNMYFKSYDTPMNIGYPGFFATYHVITRNANTPVNESTTDGYSSDENVFCNSPDLFQCFDGKKCINSTLQCDGEFDCEDKSDEAYATVRCEGVEGQNSHFQAINISSLPLNLNNYRMKITKGSWIAESKSNDSDFGPDGPHVSGYYLRTDFSNSTTAALELELERSRNTSQWGEPYCLTFWYYMYASFRYPSASGQLNVRWSENDKITWTRQGQFGQVWHKAEVQKEFPDWHDKIIFEANKIEEERLQIAIQDISVMPGPCHRNTDHIVSDDISCTFEENECQWVLKNGGMTSYVYPNFSEGPPGAAQGNRYLAPISSEPLTLVSPNVTRRGGFAFLVFKAFAIGDRTVICIWTKAKYSFDMKFRWISGSTGWHQFTVLMPSSYESYYVILTSRDGGVFFDDLAFFNGIPSDFGPVCDRSEYMCTGSFECIPRSTGICNGISECPRGEDEWNCTRSSALVDGSLNGGQIAGIVIGCLAGVALIAVFGALVISRTKKGTRHHDPPIISEMKHGLPPEYPAQPAPTVILPSQPANAYPAPVNNQGFNSS